MTLEADQAVAGACQDPHAGRPAPSLGWPGERKSIVQQAETSVVSAKQSRLRGLEWRGPVGARGIQGLRALGRGPQGAWGPGNQSGLGLKPKFDHEFRRSEKVSWWEAGEGVGDG